MVSISIMVRRYEFTALLLLHTDITFSSDETHTISTQGARVGLLSVRVDSDRSDVQLQPVSSLLVWAAGCRQWTVGLGQRHRTAEELVPLQQRHWKVRIYDITYTAASFSDSHRCISPRAGPGHPSSPLSIYFLIFSSFYFSLSFIGFTYFLLLSIPSLSTSIVPLRYQAGGRRRRPNLGLVCVLFCNLCCLYSLVKMDCGVLFYLVYFCVFLQCFDTVGWVIWPVKTRPHMIHNVLVGR